MKLKLTILILLTSLTCYSQVTTLEIDTSKTEVNIYNYGTLIEKNEGSVIVNNNLDVSESIQNESSRACKSCKTDEPSKGLIIFGLLSLIILLIGITYIVYDNMEPGCMTPFILITIFVIYGLFCEAC